MPPEPLSAAFFFKRGAVIENEKEKRTKFRPGALWTTPSVILLLCLTILPLLMLLVFSFMNRNIFAGQPWPGWTLRNITRMFGSATFWRLMGKSLLTAGEVTLICIVAAYPAAWAIAKIVKPQHRSTLMMVVILPFFTSQLLLIYAMMNLIQTGGLLLTALDAIGIHGAKTWLYTNKATVLILTYEYLPYMILCLYSSLEGINDNAHPGIADPRREQDENLYEHCISCERAGLLSAYYRVLFLAGSFVEPGLVGGAGGSMVGHDRYAVPVL